MAKRPSLFHQLLMALKDQQRFGESKHQAKRIEIARAKMEGKTGFGVAPQGVFRCRPLQGTDRPAGSLHAGVAKTEIHGHWRKRVHT